MDILFAAQRPCASLRRARRRARKVEHRAALRLARDEENAQGRQTLLDGFLVRLELRQHLVGNHRLFSDAREIRHEHTELLLEIQNALPDALVLDECARHAERGREHIHIAVDLDAAVILVHAFACEEARLPFIACFRCDAHYSFLLI